MTSRSTGRRAWSDEDLKAAVAAQKSWRAVTRQLGLAPGTTGSVRRHARRLGLDTSHFGHVRRTWSDYDLRDAVEASTTWTGVMRELDLSETSAGRSSVIARAQSLGLDVKREKVPGHQSADAVDIRDVRPDLGALWSAAERIAIAWFALRGIPVAVPTGQRAYDLLATLPDGVQRVQVKSGTRRAKVGTWQVGVGWRPYAHGKAARRLPYDPAELDYYFIIDGDGALYLIPSSVLGGRVQINIGAYAAYRVGDASSLLAVVA